MIAKKISSECYGPNVVFRLQIDAAPMPNFEDKDDKLCICDLTNQTIVADPVSSQALISFPLQGGAINARVFLLWHPFGPNINPLSGFNIELS
jgi:hypothetical protein